MCPPYQDYRTDGNLADAYRAFLDERNFTKAK